MFERIDSLVTQHGFSLQVWSDRYGRGVWAALGTWEDQVDTVRGLSSSGDLDMIPAMDYIGSTDWLPYVTGRTAHEAMTALEARLAVLPSDQLDRASDWTTMVSTAIDRLREAYLEAKNGGSTEAGFRHPPPTFEEAIQSFLPAC